MSITSVTGNRTAEIAAELLGGKMVAEFVREAWAYATPESKAQISTALVKIVLEKINSMPGWMVEDVAKGLLAETMKDVLSQHAIVIHEAIGKKSAVYTEKKVEEIAHEVYKKVADETAREIVRRIGEALAKKDR